MKSTKGMRSAVLVTALLAVAGVMAVLACGPAASTQQAVGVGSVAAKEEPTETPTPTATLHPDCVTLPLPDGRRVTSCPPPGPENVESNLRRYYNYAMATKAANAGRRSVVEPVYIDVLVYTDSVAAMRSVAEFLESARDVGVVTVYPKPTRYGAAGVTAWHVNIELVPQIAAMEGVLRVDKVQEGVPRSSQWQLSPNPAVLKRIAMDDWHAAGVTGSCVGILCSMPEAPSRRTVFASPHHQGRRGVMLRRPLWWPAAMVGFVMASRNRGRRSCPVQPSQRTSSA